MAEEEEEEDFEGVDDSAEVEQAQRLLEEIIDRCAETRVRASAVTLEDDPAPWVELEFPNGRDKAVMRVSPRRFASLLGTDFEHRAFLGDLEATINYETGEIEALVRPIGASMSSRMVSRRISSCILADEGEISAGDEFRLELRKGDRLLVLGPASQFFTAGRFVGTWSLRLVNSGEARHDDALARLQAEANSLFLSIELAAGVALNIQRRRELRRRLRRAGGKPDEVTVLKFPDYAYDDEPISLYWFAASAAGMPLVSYLAYYQCLEYYFPTYSLNEVRRQLKNALKVPGFSIESDVALGRLIQVARTSGGAGSERGQLVATIRECLTDQVFRSYLDQSTDVRDTVTATKGGLSLPRINLGKEQDVLADVASRIYSIRCRIVHTKEANNESPVLLPFSREADLLWADLELIKFVAQRVLIAASRPLH